MSIINLFASAFSDMDRRTVFLVGRYDEDLLPADVDFLVEALESGAEDLYLFWVSDESVAADEIDDYSRIGESRYTIDYADLKAMPTAPKQSLADFLRAAVETEVLADYEVDQPVLLAKAKELKAEANEARIAVDQLAVTKSNGRLVVTRVTQASVPVSEITEYAAPMKSERVPNIDGIVYHLLPQGALKSKWVFGLENPKYWASVPEAPKVEFYGRTKKDIQKLVTLYRASAEYNAARGA